MLCTANLITAQEGVNQVFTAFNDWFVDNKPNGSSSVSGGHLNVTMGDQGNGKYRADLKFQAGTNYTINSTTDKIIAVKFIGDRPATGAFKVELHNATTNTWINNGGAKYNSAGSIITTGGNNIYYFDFSGDANYGTGDIEIDRIGFTLADVVDPTNYTVDWIATFASTTDLEAYKDTKDDGLSDEDEVVLGIDDIIAKNNAFKLYPNPSTNNSFSIEFGKGHNNSVSSVKIYSILGSLVLDKAVNINANKITINHNLKSGIYIVKLDDYTSKLIVK